MNRQKMSLLNKVMSYIVVAGIVGVVGYSFSSLKNSQPVSRSESYFEGLLLADSSLIDFDGDGDVDIIISSVRYNPPTLYAVASDMIERVADFYKLEDGVSDRLPRMTREIQDLATTIFHSQKQLGMKISEQKKSLMAKK